MVNYYAVLGISPQATAAQIKSAYRRKVKTAHPDTGGSAEAMHELTVAYEALKDPSARRAYDATLKSPPAADPSPTQRSSASSQSRGQDNRESERPPAQAERRAAEPHEDFDHQKNLANTRRYVWSRVEEFGLLGLLVAVGFTFASIKANTLGIQLAAGITAFNAIYWLVLQFIYMAAPEYKLITYFTLRHPFKASPRERFILLVTMLAWLPLGLMWSGVARLLFTAP